MVPNTISGARGGGDGGGGGGGARGGGGGVGWRVEARLKMSSGVSRFNGSIIVGMKVTGQCESF